jgi:hypothetical protein
MALYGPFIEVEAAFSNYQNRSKRFVAKTP